MADKNELLLTERDVAKLLRVSLAAVRKWRLQERGPKYLKIGSLVRYRRSDLDVWLNSLPTGGAAGFRTKTFNGA